jgi:hypothetical protein
MSYDLPPLPYGVDALETPRHEASFNSRNQNLPVRLNNCAPNVSRRRGEGTR